MTLVEVVVTIALLALVVVPILAATITAIRSSRVSEEAAEVETLLVNAADRVNRTDRIGTFRCDMSQPVRAAVETAGWDPADVIVEQAYLVAPPDDWQTGPAAAPGCPASGFEDGLVQRITITITGPVEGISRTIEVVKSDI